MNAAESTVTLRVGAAESHTVKIRRCSSGRGRSRLAELISENSMNLRVLLFGLIAGLMLAVGVGYATRQQWRKFLFWKPEDFEETLPAAD